MPPLRRRQRATKIKVSSDSQVQQSNTSSQVQDASITIDVSAPPEAVPENGSSLPEKSPKRTETHSPAAVVDNKGTGPVASLLSPQQPAVRRSPRLHRSPALRPSLVRQQRSEREQLRSDDPTATSALKSFSTIKEEQILRLQLELSKRREVFREKYTAAASALRARLEMRIHRVPRHLRRMTLGELRKLHLSNQTSSPRRERAAV
ncbi:hypothetical protein V1517DRAFT_313632 [Lipomyces orientalis]|uniref:Uncharacterized protein n=1 Tax=Lipomyces orientalis TaxID=1233043 RepID=A0ACC3TXB3_9ASCO